MRLPTTHPLRDPRFYAALAAALPVWALLVWWKGAPEASWVTRTPGLFLLLAVVYPVLEEIVFRGLIQGELLRRLPRRWGALTLANLLTSAAFVAVHLLLRPSWLSAGTFPVSLVFGYFRERTGGLAMPIALHVFYNVGFLLLIHHG